MGKLSGTPVVRTQVHTFVDRHHIMIMMCPKCKGEGASQVCLKTHTMTGHIASDMSAEHLQLFISDHWWHLRYGDLNIIISCCQLRRAFYLIPWKHWKWYLISKTIRKIFQWYNKIWFSVRLICEVDLTIFLFWANRLLTLRSSMKSIQSHRHPNLVHTWRFSDGA